MREDQRWQGLQRRIGLTGGIASGKSSVSRYLHNQGIPILDADVYAHDALAPGSQATELVMDRYGTAVQLDDKSGREGEATSPAIDRQALGKIIFNHAVERLWLEQLVHPIVEERMGKEIERHSEASVIALAIPLLFETGLDKLCSEIWVVSCLDRQQQERLMARNSLSAVEAKQRIEAQWPLQRKRELADHVINNDGPPNAWHKQVSNLLKTETGRSTLAP